MGAHLVCHRCKQVGVAGGSVREEQHERPPVVVIWSVLDEQLAHLGEVVTRQQSRCDPGAERPASNRQSALITQTCISWSSHVTT